MNSMAQMDETFQLDHDDGDNNWDYLSSQTKDMQRSACEQLEKIFSEQDKLIRHLEAQEKELQLREQQLELEEAQIRSERAQLIRHRELTNESIVKKNCENMRLAEEQKRENEKLHKKVAELENLVEAKAALELAMGRMNGALELISHSSTEDEDKDLKKKMDEIKEQLEEKEEDLKAMRQLNNDLIVKEHANSDELHQARMELIDGLGKTSNRATIGVKTLGDLDYKPFLTATKRKFPGEEEEAEDKALELCSLWDSYVKDLSWQPFKIIQSKGKFEEIIIDEDDEKLKDLKNEYGDEVHKAVVIALEELNRYNPNGSSRCAVTELWNFKEDRKASLKEGIEYVLRQWKRHKRTRSYAYA